MNRAGWRIAFVAGAAAVTVIWTGDWFAGQLVPTEFPGALAFKPADDLPPAVDLASVQRGWPDMLEAPGERGRLIAYMKDIEHQPLPTVAPRAASAPKEPVDFAALLANADVAAGKGKARVCVSCHTFDRGGPNRVGPALWGVVGRRIAAHPGFAYSPALTGERGAWTYERLDRYLASPARAIPGNKMAFAGLRRAEDRAAVIKYLASLGGTAPLPQPLASVDGATSAP